MKYFNKKNCWMVILLAGMLVLGMCTPVSVYAGEVNPNEAQLVSMASGTYLYNDALYKVQDGYVGQVSTYLSRDDVDLSAGEVAAYKDLFYANLANGIEQGYLVKIRDLSEEQKEPAKDPKPGESPSDNPDSGWSDNSQPQAPAEETPQETTESATEAATEAVTETESEKNTQTENKKPERTESENGQNEPEYIDVNALEVDRNLIASDKDLELLFGPSPNPPSTEAETEKETETQSETESETETEQMNKKDYSNAKPLTNNVNLAMYVTGIIIVVVIAAGVIMLQHKASRSKKRRHHRKH